MSRTDLAAVATARVEELRKLDLATLRSLPEFVEEAPPPATKIKIGRYRTVSTSGDHVIIVQVRHERLLGMVAAVVVDGFVLCSDGAIRPLKDEEKWPYT